MESSPSTIEELKTLVCSSSRMKFVTKILYCLNFVKNYSTPGQDFLNQIGCSWCADNTKFIINSSVIGNFLNLKANTINTNFREHGFQVISNSDLRSEFPNLNIRQWKKRYCTIAPFTYFSTPSDSDKIPIISEMAEDSSNLFTVRDTQQIPNALPIVSPFQNYVAPQKQIAPSRPTSGFHPIDSWPEETRKLLSGPENISQQAAILRLMLSLPLNADQQKQLLTNATSIWLRNIGNSSKCHMELGITKLIPENSKPKDLVYQMRINFMALLDSESSSSQIDNESISSRVLTFESFLHFFVRYGSPLEAQSPLEFITFPNTSMIDDFEISSMQEEYDDPPSFIQGFMPLFRKNDVLMAFQSMQIEHPWCIIQSKQADSFALYTIPQKSNQILKIYIKYICYAEKGKRFSVQCGNEVRYESSWSSIIKLLNLQKENGISTPLMMSHKIKVSGAESLMKPEDKEEIITNEVTFNSQIGNGSDIDLRNYSQSSLSLWGTQTFNDFSFADYDRMSQL